MARTRQRVPGAARWRAGIPPYLPGYVKGILAPQIHQKLLARHDLVRVQQQPGKHSALPDAADRDPLAAVLQLKRAETRTCTVPPDHAVSVLSAPNVHCRNIQQEKQASDGERERAECLRLRYRGCPARNCQSGVSRAKDSLRTSDCWTGSQPAAHHPGLDHDKGDHA